MATGTGKTLTAAAVIKLFLRTGNAARVLFLVDRIELEKQAKRNFDKYLKNDYTTVVYKENRDDWQTAEIVVTTVQSLSYHNKYSKLFSPADFDLVISDEAHRSISGNNRAVFEYFLGYKLGLTATPRDYLKNTRDMPENDPRQWERRQLLDTYKTFGCESGKPTFQYSLLNGVQDGFLVNPVVVDARTEITTQLLSDEGYAVMAQFEDGEEVELNFNRRDFERTFFSDESNLVFCRTFLENAKHDPVSGEIGKSIVFCVSRKHAARITQMLNILADQAFPGKYQSDFALQITSDIPLAQGFTVNFANNNLNGHTTFLDSYISSKTRVCVTVGMMTTGYDCEDLLNIVFLRPIFSPTDFIQIKGRGTRKWDFEYRYQGNEVSYNKENFKLFDFFANCEYFEEDFDYDEKIKLPRPSVKSTGEGGEGHPYGEYDNQNFDPLKIMTEQIIGAEGMKIDRMMYQHFSDKVRNDEYARKQYEEGNITILEEYIKREVFDKPEEFFNMDKLRKSIGSDRRISLREILDHIFGRKTRFESKDELLDEEFKKFLLTEGQKEGITTENYETIRTLFKSYITDRALRDILDDRQYGRLATHPSVRMADIRKIGIPRVKAITEYIRDNINPNQFVA